MSARWLAQINSQRLLNQLKLLCQQSRLQSLLLHRTSRFFPSNGRNHDRYSVHLLTEGWPGWVGPGKKRNRRPAKGGLPTTVLTALNAA